MLNPCATLRFGWAFWALAVAWLCAQSPQAAVFEVVNWAAGVTHISHHDRLIADAERAISSVDKSDEVAIAMIQAKADEERGRPAALPIGSVVEKILLAFTERERLVDDVRMGPIFERADDWALFGNMAGEPLHPPPRSV